MKDCPGLLVSAPASGTGKTTLALGLMRALKRRGVAVHPFKNGPDYIDPGFHEAATGRPAYNLDSWAMSEALLQSIGSARKDAEFVVAEGSMGLLDGVADPGASGTGSSAETALRFGWPLLLVLDARGSAQTAAAVALGFKKHPDAPPLAGVVLNRVASARHERLLRDGFARVDIPVLGALPREPGLELPERHLGLHQASEHPTLHRTLDALADFVTKFTDLDAILSAGAGKATTPAQELVLQPPAQRIAIAKDAAFSFAYPHLLDAWRAAGAELIPFSPLADEAPEASADLVWFPGGYPELHAGRLSAAERCRTAVRRFAAKKPVHGECGGYMALGDSLTDAQGEEHPMFGLLRLQTSYAKRKLHLGYRLARLNGPLWGLPTGTLLRGHEFHYSQVLQCQDEPLAEVVNASGVSVSEKGSRREQVTGSFFHLISPEFSEPQ